jgi:penicillin-binding protein activator
MNTLKLMSTLTAAALMALAAGCASSGGGDWNVKRVDPATSTDVDYRFNDQDAREIFQAMARDVLARPWIDNHMRENGGQRPIVYLATIRNNTQDYINTELFTNQIQEEMINGQRVRVKAERDARQELRDERLDTRYNDPATVKAIAKEINADYAIMGSINDVKQRNTSGRTVVNYYQATLELINIETAEKVWSNTAEIKKVARR